MRTLSQVVLDVWAPLTHKRTLDGGPEESNEQPSWIDLSDWRRINAYLLRRAYMRNVARHYLVDDGSLDDHREYGDPALHVAQVTSAVLGREQTIVVDQADQHDPDPPAKPAGAEDPDTARPAEPAGAAAAYERQQWLREWADTERLPAKLLESERQSVGLGDSVYVLGWSADKQRVRVRVYDPGLYFPVLDDDDPEDFPTRVHMVWEQEAREPGEPNWLRRRTWELGPIGPMTETYRDPSSGLLRRIYALFGGDEPSTVPQPGDRVLPDGRYGRRYPWQAAGDPPATMTCYYTDASWRMDRLDAKWRLDTLPLSQATFKTTPDGQVADRIDLRIDFLPVVHVPNTVPGADHFGSAVTDLIAQVFDDISASDTDMAAAAGVVGAPILGLSGAAAPTTTDANGRSTVTLQRGAVWGLGANGRLDALDMSPQLVALREQSRELRTIASVNGRVPEALLGRIKPSEVPSGFALALGFNPFESLLGELRLVRSEKYPLLLKQVQRIAQAAGALPPGETPRAELRMGPYLPANVAEVIGQVTQRYAAGLVSLEQGLTELQAAGVPIDDIQDEAAAIRRQDFDRAEALYAATGDYRLVYLFLGRTPPEEDPRTPPPEEDPAGDDDEDETGGTGGDGTKTPQIKLRTGR